MNAGKAKGAAKKDNSRPKSSGKQMEKSRQNQDYYIIGIYVFFIQQHQDHISFQSPIHSDDDQLSFLLIYI